MEWTVERVDALRRLWLDGMSASQVARRLGGTSRNAVIGKVHRLGLAGREAPSRPRNYGGRPLSRTARGRASAGGEIRRSPRRPLTDLPAPSFVVQASATLMTLGCHACRWPIGDPAEPGFGFCGRLRGAHGPYCAGHAAMAARRTLASGLKAQIDLLARKYGG